MTEQQLAAAPAQGARMDDLFDLPSDTQPAAADPVLAPEPPAPRPAADASGAARASGVLAAAREAEPEPAGTDPATTGAETARAPKPAKAKAKARAVSFGSLRLARDMWIAFAALAASNLIILWIVLSGLDAGEQPAPQPVAVSPATSVAPPVEPPPQPAPAAAQTAPDDPAPDAGAAAAEQPAVPAFRATGSVDALMRDAQDDLQAGRVLAARARLGRVLLQIDTLEPAERDRVRAEAQLLVARSLQAEADRARRTAQ